MSCEHVEGANPRREGWCVKCGLEMPETATSGNSARNLALEDELLADMVSEAQRRFGVNVAVYSRRVKERLEIGARRYGDGDFLTKDMLVELLEETPDVGGHVILELQKRLNDPFETDTDVTSWLRESAVFGAMADYAALMAAREAARR